MLEKALQYTRYTLDQFLKNRLGSDDGTAILNKLIENNGSAILSNQNKVVISLINIEKETSKPFYVRNQKNATGGFSNINPSERYNLDVLISSNFDDYSDTLNFLNSVILFFQVNSVLDRSVNAAIPGGLEKLEFEIEKITYHQMQSLWTAMGAKYQPSVIYKMRLITMQSSEAKGFVAAVSQTSNDSTL